MGPLKLQQSFISLTFLTLYLFSHTAGLVESLWCIVPGTISFTELGLSDATWVRTELLDHGLDCLFRR
jgi:hypothetical protein